MRDNLAITTIFISFVLFFAWCAGDFMLGGPVAAFASLGCIVVSFSSSFVALNLSAGGY